MFWCANTEQQMPIVRIEKWFNIVNYIVRGIKDIAFEINQMDSIRYACECMPNTPTNNIRGGFFLGWA